MQQNAAGSGVNLTPAEVLEPCLQVDGLLSNQEAAGGHDSLRILSI
jgi:hypothetical protein